MAKRKAEWRSGAQFALPLPDSTYGVGQAIGVIEELYAVYCALSSRRVSQPSGGAIDLRPNEVVSCVALTRNQLDYGRWPVLGYASLIVDRAAFMNERFASNGYIGAKIYDARLAEDFSLRSTPSLPGTPGTTRTT